MADINSVYAGTIDVQNPDAVIAQRPGGLFGLNPIDVYLPDQIRDQMRATNAAAVSTVDAVKIEYSGTTSAERVTFLTDRLNAINKRVAFIQERTGQLLEVLKDSGATTYDALLKGFTSALKLVPVVGTVVSAVTGSADAARSLEQYKLQTLIQNYTADLEQLSQIRAQFTKELQAINPTPTDTNDPTGNAPTVPTSWLIAGLGVALIIAFLIWKRRKKSKRSRR